MKKSGGQFCMVRVSGEVTNCVVSGAIGGNCSVGPFGGGSG